MRHEKGIDAAITAALITDVIPIDGMDGVRIDDYLKYNASDAVELGVKLGVGEDGKPRWHGYSDIRNDEYDDCNRAILRPVVKAAIKAYLDASGMVMVPSEPDECMLIDASETEKRQWRNIYRSMVSCAPNPFQATEESREKK